MERRAAMEQQTIGSVLEGCRHGDRDSFRVLFETYKDRVFTIAIYSLGGDAAAASDVSQQVFLKLMTAIGQFRGDAEFTTWLYRMVVNACVDEQRRRRRLSPLGESVAKKRIEEIRPQEEHYARAELAASVKTAISELKPKFRLPILLKYVEGLSYEEIAVVLGCSKGTVASRLNRGHKALATRLSHLRGVVTGA